MSIIAGLLASIPSIVQLVQGSKQKKEAQQIEDQTQFPKMPIPPSLNKYTNYAYGRTLNQDIPGGDIYRNEIKGATAAGMKAASEMGSGAEAYGMMGNLVGREQSQFGNLAKLTAQQVAGYQGDYMDALRTKAGAESQQFAWNEAEPYMRAASMAQGLRNSGMKNQFAGISSLAGMGAEAVAGQDMMSALNSDNPNTSYREDQGGVDNFLRSLLQRLKGKPEGNTYLSEIPSD
jgi:hypothetical protein